jgi:uncharacterized protein (AIM24 family)
MQVTRCKDSEPADLITCHPMILNRCTRALGRASARATSALRECRISEMSTRASQQKSFFEDALVAPGTQSVSFTGHSTKVETDFAKETFVIGGDAQVVRLRLAPGQSVRCEPHSLLWCDDAVRMDTTVGSDFFAGASRLFSGGPLFVTEFTNTSPVADAAIVLGARYPARVLPFDLREYGGSITASASSFLAGPPGVGISAKTPPSVLGALFGGAGLFLQSLEANDVVFLHAGGAVARRDLKFGDTLKVNPGCVLAMENRVSYDVEFVSGLSNIVFGQGLFLTTLRGPGSVWLQALPWSRVERRILSKAHMNNWGGRNNNWSSHSHSSSSSH